MSKRKPKFEWKFHRSEKCWFSRKHPYAVVWYCRAVMAWVVERVIVQSSLDGDSLVKTTFGRIRRFRSREAACVAAEGYRPFDLLGSKIS